MKKQLVAVILVLALVLLIPSAANAAAIKVPLRDIWPTPSTWPPQDDYGFVIFNNPDEDDNFVLTISLKGAEKTNWDYYVYIYDYHSGRYLFYLWPGPGGILHTNGVGNGNFHLEGQLNPGSYWLVVYINETPLGHSMYGTGYPSNSATYVHVTIT